MNSINTIRYKLLSSGFGVILDRRAVLVPGTLYLNFGISDKGAIAIFNCDSGEYYRALNCGIARIDTDKLKGSVRVTVVIKDGDTPIKRWICETLYIETIEDKRLIFPDDKNLPDEMVKLRLENEDLRTSVSSLADKVSALEAKISDIMDGYDII